MKKIIYIMCFTFFLAACGEGQDKNGKTNTQRKKESKQITSCFKEYGYAYEKLLTKADISKHVTIEENSFETEISTTTGEYGSCTYTWDSDRPDLHVEMAGHTIPYPDINRVTLKMLHFYSEDETKLYSQKSAIDLFDQSYKKLDQAEYEELLDNLREKYKDDKEGLGQAEGFLKARMNLSYEPLDHLGDRAYWKWHEEYGVELVVLTGSVHFTLQSKTSADQSSSLKDAVNFAEEVLSKCKGNQ